MPFYTVSPLLFPLKFRSITPYNIIFNYLSHILPTNQNSSSIYLRTSEREGMNMHMEEGGKGRFNGMESGAKEFEEAKRSAGSGKNCDWFVRVMALVLSLTAALVAGLDSQTKVVPIKLVDSMPPLNVPVTAKWHYLSAYVYFVVGNSIACAYAAVSLLLVLTNRVKNRAMGTLVTMLDAVMVGLLFSGCGAAAAVGVLGFQGNSHVRWDKVCNVFGKFCDQAAYSVAISMLASMAFLLLMLLPLLRLHPRNYLPTN